MINRLRSSLFHHEGRNLLCHESVLKDGPINDLEVKSLTKTANSGTMIKNEGKDREEDDCKN